MANLFNVVSALSESVIVAANAATKIVSLGDKWLDLSLEQSDRYIRNLKEEQKLTARVEETQRKVKYYNVMDKAEKALAKYSKEDIERWNQLLEEELKK